MKAAMQGSLIQAKAPIVQGGQGARLRYFTTTRRGGVSQGPWSEWNLGAHCGDEMQAVTQNRAILENLLPAPVHWLNQVHGTEVVELKKQPLPSADLYAADAAFTRDPDCVLAILTADCLPIVISDENNSIVGVAHAGWRGLAGGVLTRLAQSLQRYSEATQWFAWVGPAIGAQHFEVGVEVYEAFVTDAPQDAQYFSMQPNKGAMPPKWLADLPSLAQARLNRAFASQIHIEQSGYCTFASADKFFSYRRDGITGRMATVAWMTHSAS